jgi:hypothetical protein
MGQAAIAVGNGFIRSGWEYYIGQKLRVETPLHIGAMQLQLVDYLHSYRWSES